jgi:hypothetical protein
MLFATQSASALMLSLLLHARTTKQAAPGGMWCWLCAVTPDHAWFSAAACCVAARVFSFAAAPLPLCRRRGGAAVLLPVRENGRLILQVLVAIMHAMSGEQNGYVRYVCHLLLCSAGFAWFRHVPFG